MDGSSSDNLDLQRQAIDAALKCRWDEAVRINNEIIKDQPENIPCLNRLAHAFFELGNFQQAKKLYHKVAELDPYNEIAQKNIKKISSFKKSDTMLPNGHAVVASPSLFIAEPGTVQCMNLIKLAEPQRLLTLSPGEEVKLSPKSRGVSVTDLENNYLGALPDDVAHLILKLIKGGNKYQALIRSVKHNAINILVRETFRSKRFRRQPSFLSNSQVSTYSSKHIIISDDSFAEEAIEENEEMTD